MEKTRNIFKKTRDTKRKFHAKMRTIKDINCIDLTEPDASLTVKRGRLVAI